MGPGVETTESVKSAGARTRYDCAGSRRYGLAHHSGTRCPDCCHSLYFLPLANNSGVPISSLSWSKSNISPRIGSVVPCAARLA